MISKFILTFKSKFKTSISKVYSISKFPKSKLDFDIGGLNFDIPSRMPASIELSIKLVVCLNFDIRVARIQMTMSYVYILVYYVYSVTQWLASGTLRYYDIIALL